MGIEVHPNVDRKVELLRNSIYSLFSDAKFRFEFVTAEKLLQLSRKEQTRTKELTLTDNPISTQVRSLPGSGSGSNWH